MPKQSSMSLRTALVTVVGITLWLVLAAVPSGAQGTSAETNQPPAAQAQFQAAVPDPGTGIPDSIPLNTVAPAAPDNYLIGHNDLLYVYVYQMPEFTRQVRVDDQGDIRLPFLARTLPAAGGTGRQLAERVEKALVASELARNPMVSVVVRQVMSQPIVVGGAVREPLNLQSPRSMTLLELIARAGGLSDSPPAGMEAIVMNNPPDRKQVTRVNLSQLLRGEGDYVSMPIQGGATVMVMTAPKVYAIGALNKPGAFPLGVGESISALRLVALAEGVKAPAMESHAEIIRLQADGSRVRIPVDLGAVLRHKVADPQLQAGDLFYLPVNGRRELVKALLADVGQAAVIAIGYGHVF